MADWRALFNERTLAEGLEYFTQGKAKKLTENDFGFSVRVRGSRNYSVEIGVNYEGEIDDLDCSCEESEYTGRCKHMAAALYLLSSKYPEIRELDPEWAEMLGLDGEDSVPGALFAPVLPDPDDHSGKKTSGTKIIPFRQRYGESLRQMEQLQAEEERDRRESADPAEEQQTADDYRFFQVNRFREGLTVSKATLRKAQKMLENGEVSHYDSRVGYFPFPRSLAGTYTVTNPEDTGFHGNITAHSRDGRWYADVWFDRTGIRYSRCGRWECSFRAKPAKGTVDHELCEHEACALLLTEMYLRDNNPGDATSSGALNLLENYGASAPLTADPEQADQLRLRPQIRIDRYGNWSAQFQVGSGRLYKIKNLHEFVLDTDEKKRETFGKKTELQLGEAYLDDQGKRWLQFLRDAIHILCLFGGDPEEKRDSIYYYGEPDGWTKLTDRMPLFGEILDRFFDAAGGEAVEAEKQAGGSREKCQFHMKEGTYRPQLTLEPVVDKKGKTYEGIRLTGTVPAFLSGSSSSYYQDGDTLFRVPRSEETALRPLLQSAAADGTISLTVGRSHLAEFYRRVLPELKKAADVTEIHPEVTDGYLPMEPSFVCYLDVLEEQVLCRPEVYYGSKRLSPLDVYRMDEAGFRPETFRDMPEEERLIRHLESYMPEHDTETGLFAAESGEESLYAFLEHGLNELLSVSEVRATERFNRLKVRSRVPLHVGVSLNSGIMNLDLTTEDLSPDELLEVMTGYRRKAQYVRLKNGDFLRLQENEALRQLFEMMEVLHISPKEMAQGHMDIPAFRALYLDTMLEEMQDAYADRDVRFKKLVKEFKTVSDADFSVPAGLKGTLRKYQEVGYRWLRTLDEYGFGGILADDMGLGKTLQVITVLQAVRQEETAGDAPAGGSGTSLVVCPASLVYNWQEELLRFAPGLRVLPVVGTAAARKELIGGWKNYDVLVTSYDLLKRDIAEYEGISFRFEIIDEAQYIKNHLTAAAKSVKLIRAQTKYALTGTPIENRLSDLWSIFDYLMPGFLYDYGTFRSEIEQPAVKYEDREALEKLHRMAGPFILRRSKKEVLKDLPDKLEEIRYARFEPASEQEKLYNAEVVRMRKELRSQTDEDFRQSRIRILAELTRIRQICCDPRLLFEEYRKGSAKTEACLELIRSVVEGEHKALVFSQFTSMLSLLEEALDKEGIAYYKIIGSTSKEDRARLVKAFNEDSTPVFLISLKAGGTGLNLTGADVVIHYDPWWNIAAQNQATDRAHRIGQTKVVTVYRLILKGTIEDRIVELQESKRALAEEILSAEAVSSSRLNREELLELLE